MRCSISQAARRAGVSVRTLRYYDEIGLLKPSEVSPSGYRYYDGPAMEALQQIVFYRELGVGLEQIRTILSSPEDRTQALQKHRRLLLLKRQRLDDMLRLVDETIGGKPMYQERPRPTKEELDAFRAEYAREAAERWGNTEAFMESREKHAGYTERQEEEIHEEMEEIFRAFGGCKDPAAPEAQALVRRWQEHITRYHYNCTDGILSCLGEMYVNDPRMKANLDQYGPGTAQLMHDAIKCALRQ